jgi:hypothetical protein
MLSYETEYGQGYSREPRVTGLYRAEGKEARKRLGVSVSPKQDALTTLILRPNLNFNVLQCLSTSLSFFAHLIIWPLLEEWRTAGGNQGAFEFNPNGLTLPFPLQQELLSSKTYSNAASASPAFAFSGFVFYYRLYRACS